MEKNVLGTDIKTCGCNPVTGFFRDGFCNTGEQDRGIHTVCGVMTNEFLQFSKDSGNDLITPHPEWNFPGLKAGDRWCLCAGRWLEAYQKNCACPVVLESTHEETLAMIDLSILKKYRFIEK